MIKYKKVTGSAVSMQARPVGAKTYTGKDIAGIIEKEISIPAIRTMSVLNAVAEVIARQLAEGDTIRIEGLGTLRAGVSFESGKPVAKRLIVAPSAEIKQALSAIQFEEIMD